MEKNDPKVHTDAGSMLSQKTNEDFNKKKPEPNDLIQSKTYQKDKMHTKPDQSNSDHQKIGKKTESPRNQKSQKKTDDTAGAEFIDKE